MSSIYRTAEIKPSKANGKISVPPSKSMAHRYLICAGLAEGKSTVHGITESNDILATLNCLRALGAEVKIENGSAEIVGFDRCKVKDGSLLPCFESGSTLRFFLPISLLVGKKITFTGSETLFSRPLSVYEKICKEEGFDFSLSKDCLSVKGELSSGNYRVAGNISSQFISGLLFALPTTDGYSIVETESRAESKPYINMTLSALSSFGVSCEWASDKRIIISGNQKYKSREITVEGDYSSAAVFDALNLFGGNVILDGLKNDSLQGDKIYKEYFEKLKNGYAELDFCDCPDIAPICMAVSANLYGGLFTGVRRLRLKESDRIAAMTEELSKFGVSMDVGEDFVIVKKSELHTPKEELCSHNDHRIAMALAVLSMVYGGRIQGAEAVEKSFPDFFEKLYELGVDVSL